MNTEKGKERTLFLFCFCIGIFVKENDDDCDEMIAAKQYKYRENICFRREKRIIRGEPIFIGDTSVESRTICERAKVG